MTASESAARPRRIAVIGGGVTGLAAAHRLTELDPSTHVTLFEAGDRAGGVIHTVERAGYLLEQSADSFVTNVPWGLDLCRRLGLETELIATQAAHRRALIVHRGRLEAAPDGFMLMAPARLWPVVRTPLLSWRGKLRLLAEAFLPRRRETTDESLADFARRRLGREAFERIVQPLVSGIYTADAEQLSLAAALPRFVEMERRYGSLIRAARIESTRGETGPAGSGARYGLFVAPRHGLSSLIEALAARLPAGAVQLNTPIERLARTGRGWQAWRAGQAQPDEFDGLIVALRAPQAARLLADVDTALAAELRQIPYAGCAIALAGYSRSQIGRELNGFGFVVPEVERRRILAASFSSVKFAGRAPADRVLARIFFGGAMHPEMMDLSDAALAQIAQEEMEQLIALRGPPEFFEVCRWPASMPQYHVGHLERVGRIRDRASRLGDLALAGNAYEGVGIPHCIHSGEQAAEEVCGGGAAPSGSP